MEEISGYILSKITDISVGFKGVGFLDQRRMQVNVIAHWRDAFSV